MDQQSTLPTAAIIVIGNEILSGLPDQNVSYIAKGLNKLGIHLQHVHIIGDVLETIVETVRHCHAKYTYVFTTGGIGPTHDDITAEAVATAFNASLELNKEAEKIMLDHYGNSDIQHWNDARLRMALIPKGATLINNPSSAAPGFRLENVFVLAGVPDIARAMFDEIASLLKPGPKLYAEMVHCMLAESLLAEELRNLQARFHEVDIGSYPYFKNRTYGLSLVLRGINQDLVSEATKAVMLLITQNGGIPERKNLA